MPPGRSAARLPHGDRDSQLLGVRVGTGSSMVGGVPLAIEWLVAGNVRRCCEREERPGVSPR